MVSVGAVVMERAAFAQDQPTLEPQSSAAIIRITISVRLLLTIPVLQPPCIFLVRSPSSWRSRSSSWQAFVLSAFGID